VLEIVQLSVIIYTSVELPETKTVFGGTNLPVMNNVFSHLVKLSCKIKTNIHIHIDNTINILDYKFSFTYKPNLCTNDVWNFNVWQWNHLSWETINKRKKLTTH